MYFQAPRSVGRKPMRTRQISATIKRHEENKLAMYKISGALGYAYRECKLELHRTCGAQPWSTLYLVFFLLNINSSLYLSKNINDGRQLTYLRCLYICISCRINPFYYQL